MEYFKVVKLKNNTWTVEANSAGIIKYSDTNEFPHCFLSDAAKCYKFSLKYFFRYLISKFGANISLLKGFPYFSISFDSEKNAKDFCKELNRRA